ncbi:DUF1772 domain-containing protein [Gimesia chilikensis]|uniref:anthrone oxygenase family protein n=1 Tax=Gimesia chilikensis TaxID=2605989 RepID=UPI0011EBF731|nr:DUF1772 domain-containing protein [Gimesia chilikensis]KAA0131514.1 DUF1772 domain-containing protein [Gimesia chilikensis]
MDFLEMALVAATLLCSLVAGFLFAFAVVVMPGISSLSDQDFICAFRVMDRVIQNNQPLFMLVWIGSMITLIIFTVLGISELPRAQQVILAIATSLYLLAVQLPTLTKNIPLNNKLQSLSVEEMGAEEFSAARDEFENRWKYWNAIRTVSAIVTSLMLIILLSLQ